MHEVGLAEHSEVRAVVDDERHAEPPGHLPRLLERRQELASRQGLLAELDDVHPTVNRRFEELGEIRARAA